MKKITTENFDRISHDINGNPRYVCHFHALLNEQDREHAKKLYNDKKPGITGYEIEWLYDKALQRAKKLGGRKFHNKQYGGGIVFQSYNLQNTCDALNEYLQGVQYVKFLIERDEPKTVWAYFPYDDEGNGKKGCYAHVGQHSIASPEYAAECKPATTKQYADLKKELEAYPYNYKLEVIK